MGTLKFLILVMMVNLITGLFHAEPAKALRQPLGKETKAGPRPRLLDWKTLESYIRQGDLLF